MKVGFLECSKPKSLFENSRTLFSSLSNPSADLHNHFCWKNFVVEKSAPGKIKDLSLICALQLIAMTCHSILNINIFLMKLRNFLHFNIFLICWLSIKNRALKFSLEFGKINSKWDRHTLKIWFENYLIFWFFMNFHDFFLGFCGEWSTVQLFVLVKTYIFRISSRKNDFRGVRMKKSQKTHFFR